MPSRSHSDGQEELIISEPAFAPHLRHSQSDPSQSSDAFFVLVVVALALNAAIGSDLVQSQIELLHRQREMERSPLTSSVSQCRVAQERNASLCRDGRSSVGIRTVSSYHRSAPGPVDLQPECSPAIVEVATTKESVCIGFTRVGNGTLPLCCSSKSGVTDAAQSDALDRVRCFERGWWLFESSRKIGQFSKKTGLEAHLRAAFHVCGGC